MNKQFILEDLDISFLNEINKNKKQNEEFTQLQLELPLYYNNINEKKEDSYVNNNNNIIIINL
jgi:hypothetical protein